MARCQARREEALVPVAGEEAPAIARQFVGEVLAPGLRLRWTVAVKPGGDAEDLGTQLVAEAPGRKSDRGEVRLQMARRQADDQPPDPAGMHRRQFRGDQLDMPIHQKLGARVELAERARGKARKVMIQQGGAIAPGRVPGDSRFRHVLATATPSARPTGDNTMQVTVRGLNVVITGAGAGATGRISRSSGTKTASAQTKP